MVDLNDPSSYARRGRVVALALLPTLVVLLALYALMYQAGTVQAAPPANHEGGGGSPLVVLGTTYVDNERYTMTAVLASGTLTVPRAAGVSLATGDEIVIINMQGADAGRYETAVINQTSSSVITLTTPLLYSYNGSSDKIMVQRIPHYSTVVVESGGNLTAHDWNGQTGGLVFFRAVTVTVKTGGRISVDGLGYRGGGSWGTNGEGYRGESITGLGGVGGYGGGSNAPNIGGGGVHVNGAGGNYGGSATHAQYYSGGNPGTGLAGLTYGNAELRRLHLGSGGGGGNGGSYGGDGGGILVIDAEQLTVAGNVEADGAAGSGGPWGSGGGSGGSIHLQVDTAGIGSQRVTAGGGSRYCASGCGGFGGIGRIRVDYETALTGLSSPSALEVAADGQMDLTLANDWYVDDVRTPVSGTVAAGATALPVVDSSNFRVGDEILVISLQGPEVGFYETKLVTAVAGGLLTLDSGLAYGYNAVLNRVMVQQVLPFDSITVQNGGSLLAHDWDGSTGGVIYLRAQTVLVENGGRITATGLGYRGGGSWGPSSEGYQGESINGLGSYGGYGPGPNGPNIGGGGVHVSGAGGNYGGGATNAQYYNAQVLPGTGLAGLSYGHPELRRLYLGSGGGGGNGGSYGGDGAGILVIESDQLTVQGFVEANGAPGSGGPWGAGGGSGGSVHLQIGSADLGSDRVTAGGGSRYCGAGCGGFGGIGRIRVDYDSSVSGTTAPRALRVSTAGQVDLAVNTIWYLDEIRTAVNGVVAAGDTVVPVADSRDFRAGDEVVLITLQGPEVGLYETGLVTAVAPGSLTFSSSLLNGYDGTTNKVMAQRVSAFDSLLVENGGIVTAHDWDGTTGGVLFFRTVTMTVQSGGRITAAGLGYRGGGSWGPASEGYQGESIYGVGSYGGYGGGTNGPNQGGGGVHVSGAGGNYGGGATNAQYYSGGTPGTGLAGLTYGTSELRRLYLGSGGGGGNGGSYGGDGGGIIFIDVDQLNVQAPISADGAAGSGGPWGSGGGSGGSLHLQVDTADLGFELVTALGGSRYCGSGCGGFGGTGRIRLDYTTSLTGTTAPRALEVGAGGSSDISLEDTLYVDETRTALNGNVLLGETSLPVADSTEFAAGDEVLIIVMQGPDVGLYETRVVTAVVPGTLSLTHGVERDYDATANKVMVQRVPFYNNLTVQNGGLLTAHDWDGTTGGVLFFRALTTTVETGGRIDASGLGYRGGGSWGPASEGYQGESINGLGTYGGYGFGPNGPNNGGGGVHVNGAGGNYGGGATNAQYYSAQVRPGTGLAGESYGTAELRRLYLGSGGGGGNGGSYGGDGGGILIIDSQQFIVSGTVRANGANGSGGPWGAGGGSGGSIQLYVDTADLGFELVTALGGSRYCGSGCGGFGGTGRIRVDYVTSLSGTTAPRALEVKADGGSDIGLEDTLYVDETRTALTGSVTAGDTVLPVASSDEFAAGDEVLIIVMQGPAAGLYETKVVTAVTPGLITLASGLDYSYNATSNKVMVQRVPYYDNITIENGGLLTAHDWDGTTGGVVFFRAMTLTVQSGGRIEASGLGYRGGGSWGPSSEGYQGESINGLGTYGGYGPGPNGPNDGGGGVHVNGAGGNYAGGATNAQFYSGTRPGTGLAGLTYGTADLQRLQLGSGGGGGNGGSYGGDGGGVIFIDANQLVVLGTIKNDGNNGSGGPWGSGGGSGGSVYLRANWMELGSNQITTLGGSRYCGSGCGGFGGLGRIRLDYTFLEGSTNPAAGYTQPLFATIWRFPVDMQGWTGATGRESWTGAVSHNADSTGSVRLNLSGAGSAAITLPISTPVTSDATLSLWSLASNSASNALSITISSATSSSTLLNQAPLATAWAWTGQLSLAAFAGETITITVGAADSVSGTVWIDDIVLYIGRVDETHSLFEAGPSEVTADGVTTAVLTATLANSFGQPMPHQNVIVSISGGGHNWLDGQPIGGNQWLAIGNSDSNGVVTATLASTEAGPRLILARTGSTSLLQTPAIHFVAGPASQLQILLPGETAAPGSSPGQSGAAIGQTAGVPFSLTVQAVDAYWNVAATVADTVDLTTTDGAAVLPASVILVNGTADVPATYLTAGLHTIYASDSSDPLITAVTSSNFNVTAAPAVRLELDVPANLQLLETASPAVTAYDAYDNIATSYGGQLQFSSSDPLATVPADYTFTAGDAGSHTFTAGLRFRTAGSHVLTVTDSFNSSLLVTATILVGNDVVITQDTTWNEAAVILNSLTITNNARLTLQGSTTITAAHILVAAGAALSADGTGYGSAGGPGAGQYNYDNGAGGGGHGGYGGYGLSGAAGGGPYDSVYEPVAWGSGGGNRYGEGSCGGRGGGAIHLVVLNSLQLDGALSAAGTAGAAGDRGCGGGAGGSLWLDVNTLAGAGAIQANGGAASGWGRPAGGGAGGRIALYVEQDNFSGSRQAEGGSGYQHGGPGTIYRQEGGSGLGSLLVNNGGHEGAAAGLVAGEYEFDTITLAQSGHLTVLDSTAVLTLTNSSDLIGDGSARLTSQGTLVAPTHFNINNVTLLIEGELAGPEVISTTTAGGLYLYAETPLHSGPYSLTSLHVGSGTTVWLSPAENGEVAYSNGLELQAENVTIETGGLLTADGLGYASQSGPGAGQYNYDAGAGGASHGGLGGVGGSGAGSGPTYGQIYEPTTLGSGGGNRYSEGSCGGAGGGAIHFVISGLLQVNGSLSVNGNNGAGGQRGCGGGSGGSLWLETAGLSGNGAIRANGGSGSGSGGWAAGGGGGGRIAVYADLLTFSGTMQVNGGAGNQAGGLGTLYLNAVDPAYSTIQAVPNSLIADGVGAATITVTLRNSANLPLDGKVVELRVVPENGVYLNGQPMSGYEVMGTSNGDGTVTAVLTSTVTGLKVIDARTTSGEVLTQTAAITFTVGPVDLGQSQLVTDKTTVLADGVDQASMTATLLDSLGHPIAGKIVTIQTAGSSLIITQPVTMTNSQGQVQATIRSTEVQVVSVTAVDQTDGLTLTQTVTLTFVPGPADALQSSINVSPTSLLADGVSTTTISGILRDALGHPTAGRSIRLLVTGSNNTINPAGVTTAGPDGSFSFTLASTTVETKTITIRDLSYGLNLPAGTVVFTAGAVDPAESELTADRLTIAADGTDQGTLTAVLRDSFGHGLPGRVVLIQASGVDLTLTQLVTTTNSQGQVQATIRSATMQTVTVTAYDQTDGLLLNDSLVLTFSAPPADANNSAITVYPTVRQANNIETVVVTATLRDALNRPLANRPIRLLVTGSNNKITPTPQLNTDANGRVVFYLASTRAEIKQLSLRDVDTGVIIPAGTVQFIPISVHPNRAIVDVLGSPLAAADGQDSVLIRVTARDLFDNPIPNATVILTSTGPVSFIQPLPTNSAGQTIGYVRSTTTGSAVIRAIIDGVLINDTASVSFEGPDLAVAKSGPSWVTSGYPIVYNLTIANQGFLTATNVLVTDTLPARTFFITQTSPYSYTFDAATRKIVWQVGTMPAGQTVSFNVQAQVAVTATAGSFLVNQLTGRLAEPELDTANNQSSSSTLVKAPVPVLSVSPQYPTLVVEHGLTNTLTITVRNDGTGLLTAATVITPPHISWVGLSQTELGDLLPGQAVTFTLTADASFASQDGHYRDRLRIDTGNAGSLDIFLDIHVRAPLRDLELTVSNNVSQTVPVASVILSEPILVVTEGVTGTVPYYRQLSTNGEGKLLLTGLETGKAYGFTISAANHQGQSGSVNLVAGSGTQQWSVVLNGLPGLGVNPGSVTFEILRGDLAQQELVIRNTGVAELGDISLESQGVPFIYLGQPPVGTVIPAGEQVAVTVNAAPLMTETVDVYNGTITVQAGGQTANIPLQVKLTDIEARTLCIEVKTDLGSPLTEAIVKLTDLSGQVVASGGVTETIQPVYVENTANVGTVCYPDLHPGPYHAEVGRGEILFGEKEIEVVAGEGIQQELMVVDEPSVTATWTVIPTSITDVYTTVLTLTFIPHQAPRLALSADRINLCGDEDGITSQVITVHNFFPVTITNVSLTMQLSGNVTANVSTVDGSASGNGTSPLYIGELGPNEHLPLELEASLITPVCQGDQGMVNITVEGTHQHYVPESWYRLDGTPAQAQPGQRVDIPLKLVNVGFPAASNLNGIPPTIENVTLTPPQTLTWMDVSTTTIASIPVDSEVDFDLIVTPPQWLAEGFYYDYIQVNATNGITALIGIEAEMTSTGLRVETQFVTPIDPGAGSTPPPPSPGGGATPPETWQDIVTHWNPDVFGPEDAIIGNWQVIVGCYCSTPGGGGGGGGWSWVGNNLIHVSGGGGGSPSPGVAYAPEFRNNVVILQLTQRFSLEREAFTAQLNLSNGLASSLQDVEVSILFTNGLGNAIPTRLPGEPFDPIGDFDPMLPADSLVPTQTLMAGTPAGWQKIYPVNFIIVPETPTDLPSIPGGQSQFASWTLIPDAAGLTEQAFFQVQAIIRYKVNGIEKMILTQPQSISVSPQPRIVIDYFLPNYVLGGETFDWLVVATNVGYGTANNFRVETPQPKILQQSEMYPTDFTLIGPSVLNWGNVAPGQQVSGVWRILPSNPGSFVDWSAECQHQNYQGVELPPLVYCLPRMHFLDTSYLAESQQWGEDQCSTGTSQRLFGDPVNTFSGNFTYSDLDLSIPTWGPPLEFERSYNSRDEEDGPLGPGWTHNYNVSLKYETFIGMDQEGIIGRQTYFSVRLPHGSMAYFDVSADGNTLTAFPGVRMSLTRHLDTYTLIHHCSQETYTFNAQQRLTAIEDANGNRIELTYDAFGRLIRATESAGRYLTFNYDSGGHLIRMTDPLGRTAIYSYTLGYLSAVTDFRGNLTRYTYTLPGEKDGQLRTILDSNGNTIVRNHYDNNRRVDWQEDALGNRTSYNYLTIPETKERTTTVTAPQGNVQVDSYNGDGQLVRHVDGNGYSETYDYDEEGNLIRQTDKNGHITLYGWEDCDCAMDELVDPMGNTTIMTYDVRNQISTVRDERGYLTAWSYDGQTNPLAISNALGDTQSFTYGSHGEKLTETDENGHTIAYGYDAYGYTTVITNALGQVSHMSYDLAGRLLSSTDPLNHTTTYLYDAEDNVLSTSNALSETTSFSYDAVGNMLTMTDALGRVTTYQYNQRNDLVRVTNPLGGVQQFGYDATGNIISRTDENGRTSQYIYSGLTLTITDPEGGSIVYSSDPAGNRLSERDANGNTTSFVYDDNDRLVTTIYPDGSQMLAVYNPADNLLRLTDGEGRLIRYTYDALGRTTSQTDPEDGTILFEYDGVGNQTAITDAEGRRTEYEYDALDRLVRVIDPLGGIFSFSYDAAGNQIGKTDPNGRTTSMFYDAANRLIQVTDPLTGTTHYAYNAVGNQVRVIDPLGRVTTIAYDALNRPVTLTNPISGTLFYQYDPVGNLLRATDEDGRTTRYAYDGLNRTIVMTDAIGGVSRYAYDGNGNRVQLIDPAGRLTSYQYDVFNQLIRQTDPLNGVTLYEYDAVGNLLEMTDANGRSTHYAYDDLDRVTVVTDTLGNTTTYHYDAVGNLLTLTDPEGNASQYSYDDLNRLLSLTNALSNTTSYGYDAVGNLLQLTDAEGRVTTYQYDALDRLVELTDALNQSTGYAYDAIGNQISLLDARGYQTSFAYDGADRLIGMTNPISGTTVYNYSPAGDLLSELNALGQLTSYSYDALHRPVNITDPLGQVISYTYDAVGNPLAFTDPLSRTTFFAYDALNRLVQVTDPLGGTTGYSYDPAGNQLTATDANGRTVQFDYDGLNRLVTVTDPLAQITEFEYDAVGNQISLTDPLGRTTFYSYDALYRLLTVTDPAGGQTSYSYDRVDNALSTTDPEGRTMAVAYDALNRPSVVTDPLNGTISFSYDPVGNQTGMVDAAGRVMTYTYDALDRLQTMVDPLQNVTQYDYDAMGNLTGLTDPLDRVTGYQYDALNRLVQVTDPLSGTTRLEYDPVGNLVRQLDPLNNETRYTLDALDRVTAVTDARNGLTSYDYDAVGNLLQTTDAEGHSSEMAYDALDRLVSLTNPLGHTTSYDYDAVGNLIATTDALGHQTDMAYDLLDRLVTLTDPLGRTTSYDYDAVGNQVGMRDAQGVRTSFQYDGLNRLTQVTENYIPRGPVNAYSNVSTYFGYDPVGNLTELINPLDYIFTFEYDDLDRLVTARDPLNLATSYQYDKAGNLAQMVDPNQNLTSYSYDPLNRVTQVVRPDETVSFSYDAAGNRLTMSDLTGLTSYSYDDLYRLTAVTDPLSQTVQYGYDAIGNRTGLTYPDGSVASYEYDDANQLLTVNDWNNGQATYQYDEAGRLIQVTLPNGISGTLSYDGANQLTLLQYQDGGDTVAHYAYSYDQVGNRTQAIETTVAAGMVPLADFIAPTRSGVAALDVTFFNLSQNATSYTWDFGDGQVLTTSSAVSLTHTYSQTGLYTVTLTAENDDFSRVLVRYDYIEVLPAGGESSSLYGQSSSLYGRFANRPYRTDSWFVVKEEGVAGRYAAERRQDAGQLAAVILSDPMMLLFGPLALIAPFASRRRRRQAQWLTAVLLLLVLCGAGWALASGAGFTDTAHAFDLPAAPAANDSLDPFANTNESVARLARQGAGPRTINYAYDPLNRLTEAAYSDGETYGYEYDAAGNRVGESRNGRLISSYLYDEANRLVLNNNQLLSYDDNGNLLDDGKLSYSYDSANRLTTVQGESSTIEYSYNGDNARVAQVIDGLRTDFVPDVAQPLPQVLTSRTAGTVSNYLRGLGLIGEEQGGTGSMAPPAVWQYVLPDALGSVRQLSDAQGQITFSQDFDPFGTAINVAGDAATAYGFAGEEQEPLTGLVYLRARTYNPASGRFLQQDSVLGDPNQPRTLHRYNYAFSNPITYTDPSGHMPAYSSNQAGGGSTAAAPISGGGLAYPLRAGGLIRSVNALAQGGGNSSGPGLSGFGAAVCGFLNGLGEAVENLASEVEDLIENVGSAINNTVEFLRDGDTSHLVDAYQDLRSAAQNISNIAQNPIVQMAVQIAIALSPLDMVYDAACLLAGKDLITGEPLSDFEKAAIVVGLVTGIGDELMQMGGKAGRFADDVADVSQGARGVDNVGDAAKAANTADALKDAGNSADALSDAARAANRTDNLADSARLANKVDDAGSTARLSDEANNLDNVSDASRQADTPAPVRQADDGPTPRADGDTTPNGRGAADDAPDRAPDNTVCPYNSFTAGTLVATEDGLVPIEDIEIGDKVLAEDPETGEQGYFEVVALTDHPTDEIVQVTIGDDDGDDGDEDGRQANNNNGNGRNVLHVTAEHPVYVEGQGWTLVENLELGDRLRRADGGMAKVLAIDQIQLPAPVSVYNFTVAGPHTYFVLDSAVLVHNCRNVAEDARNNAGTNAWKDADNHSPLSEADQNKVIQREFDKANDAALEDVKLGRFKDMEGVSGYQRLDVLDEEYSPLVNYGYVEGAIARGEPIRMASDPLAKATHLRGDVRSITSREIQHLTDRGWGFVKDSSGQWWAKPGVKMDPTDMDTLNDYFTNIPGKLPGSP